MQLFFDLDHTLWDFETNAATCLKTIHKQLILDKHPCSFPEFYESFSAINRALWIRLERGEITHDYIRENRFRLALESRLIAIDSNENQEMNAIFLELLSEQTALMPHCLEVLENLSRSYPLHIISNGFSDIQVKKLKNSGIDHFFHSVITNEIAGFRKPHPGIFNFALENAQCLPENAVMIGDSYEADILGAEGAGIKAFYLHPENPEKHPRHIRNLKELIPILA